jgi:hypothetical protein
MIGIALAVGGLALIVFSIPPVSPIAWLSLALAGFALVEGVRLIVLDLRTR